MAVDLSAIRERTEHFIEWVGDHRGETTTKYCQVTVNLEVYQKDYHPAFPEDEHEEVLEVLLQATDESWGEDQLLMVSSSHDDEGTWNCDQIPENAEEIIQSLRSLIADILEPVDGCD